MNPTSSNYWLRRVIEAGLPVPRTVSVPYDHREMVGVICGEHWDGHDDLMEALERAVREIGLPAFVRTDMGSAKHDGPVAYKLERGERMIINRLLARLVEDQEMKFGFMAEDTPSSILVREWLRLPGAFEAFGFGGNPGHPIAREWRFFATPWEVQCAHFYWPAAAIEDHRPTDDNWRELLADMANEPPPQHLGHMAMRAASVCDALPAWSVDFAEDVHGGWWLIDMADAAQSWHPDHEEAADAAV